MEESILTQDISIQFTRFSAFYSPLIATIAGGFLEQEGLRPGIRYRRRATRRSPACSTAPCTSAQSAPSQGFAPLEQGKKPPALHFAQINEMDGFFLAGRAPSRQFAWDRLKGRQVLVDHGGQPLAMFKYACYKRGLDVQEHHR